MAFTVQTPRVHANLRQHLLPAAPSVAVRLASRSSSTLPALSASGEPTPTIATFAAQYSQRRNAYLQASSANTDLCRRVLAQKAASSAASVGQQSGSGAHENIVASKAGQANQTPWDALHHEASAAPLLYQHSRARSIGDNSMRSMHQRQPSGRSSISLAHAHVPHSSGCASSRAELPASFAVGPAALQHLRYAPQSRLQAADRVQPVVPKWQAGPGAAPQLSLPQHNITTAGTQVASKVKSNRSARVSAHAVRHRNHQQQLADAASSKPGSSTAPSAAIYAEQMAQTAPNGSSRLSGEPAMKSHVSKQHRHMPAATVTERVQWSARIGRVPLGHEVSEEHRSNMSERAAATASGATAVCAPLPSFEACVLDTAGQNPPAPAPAEPQSASSQLAAAEGFTLGRWQGCISVSGSSSTTALSHGGSTGCRDDSLAACTQQQDAAGSRWESWRHQRATLQRRQQAIAQRPPRADKSVAQLCSRFTEHKHSHHLKVDSVADSRAVDLCTGEKVGLECNVGLNSVSGPDDKLAAVQDWLEDASIGHEPDRLSFRACTEAGMHYGCAAEFNATSWSASNRSQHQHAASSVRVQGPCSEGSDSHTAHERGLVTARVDTSGNGALQQLVQDGLSALASVMDRLQHDEL